MKNKTLRRVLTIILSLTFVLSTVFGALSTVSAVDNSSLTPRATVVSDAERALPEAPAGTTNLVLGMIPTVYKNTGSADSVVGAPDSGTNVIGNLTDGLLTTKTDLGGFRFNDGAGNDMSETYSTALTFELPVKSDLNQLVVVNDGGLASTITEHYAVFASDKLSDLYNNSNFVIDINSNTNQRNIITFNSGFKARYVGIRVYDPGNLTSANSQYVRMYEIALFGVMGEISTSAEVITDSTVALPGLGAGETNLISGKLPKFYYDNGTTTLTESPSPENDVNAAPASYITDGDPATSAALGGDGLRYNSNGTFMAEIWATYWTFDLEVISDISKLTFIHHNNPAIITKHFQVYASSVLADLYKVENMVANVEDNDVRRTIVNFPANTKARYVGIKYLNPGDGSSIGVSNRYVRINELALYGVKGTDVGPDGENTDAPYTVTDSNNYELDATLGEKNFIAGRTDSFKAFYYSDFGNALTTGTLGFTLLGDGAFNDNLRVSSWFFAEYDAATNTSKYIGNGIPEGKYWADLYIPLGGKKSITGFQMMHAGSYLSTYKYQIYVANSEDDLFKSTSLVIDHINAEGKKTNSFKMKDAVEGEYVGIRILDPTYAKGEGNAMALADNGNNNIYPRIQEFAVYGSDIEGGGSGSGGGSTIDGDVVLDNTLEMPETTEKNLLQGLNFYSLNFINNDPNHPKGVGTFNCKTSGGGDTLTDGLPTGDWRSSSNMAAYFDEENSKAYYIGDGIEEGSMYFDMVFDIGTESTLTKLAIFNHVDRNLRTRKYELYFGNKASTLFDNKFYSVDNVEGAQRNYFDLKKLNGDEAVVARYMGIRIIDPTYGKGVGATIVTNNLSNGNNIYPRFNEVALYGEYNDPNYGSTSILFDNTSKIPDWGRNLTKGFYPKGYGTTSEGTGAYSPVSEPVINDLDLAGDDYRYNTFKFASQSLGTIKVYGSNGDNSRYLDLVYDLRSEAVIDGMAIFHHRTTALRTKDYEIFASVKYDELFNAENSKGRVDNLGYFRNAWNYKELGQSFNARYIAIRVYNPTQYEVSEITVDLVDNIYLRLIEWAIFGQYVDGDFVYKEKFTPLGVQSDYSRFEAQGVNILSGQVPAMFQVGGGAFSVPASSALRFVDGDVKTGFDISDGGFQAQDGSTYMQMYYDLSEKGTKQYNISSFIYLGLNQNNPAAVTGWWQLYLSDDEDVLWDPSSMVFEYNNLDLADPDPNCQGQLITFDKPIIAAYIGIRILACNTTLLTSVYPRIYELGAFGEEAPVDTTPVNLATKMPAEAYTVGSADELEKLSDSDFTLKMTEALTDGDYSSKAVFETSKKPLNLVYNLCQETELYELAIRAAQGENFKKVKIYMSDSLAGVWDEKSLVTSYSGSGKNVVSKKFSKEKVARYVRFEILDKSSTVSVAEIEIIGPRFRLLRSKNLARNNASIEYFTQNNKTKKITYFAPRNAKLINNSSLGDAFGFSEGIEGKDTVNMIALLDDVKTINKISINFPDHATEFMPTLTEIYVAETLEELLSNKDIEPVHVVKGLPKDSIIEFETKPVVGQYVLVKFIKGGKGYGYFKEMSYALAEFRVYGTAVKGLNADSTNVIEFEDKDLGIKWGITKLTDNDIYSEVATSTVTVSKVTNWQKRSLEKTPYMEIVGGKKYTFKFYDVTGKEVTDFGARKVAMSFKYRGGMQSTTSMVGFAGNKWYIEPYDSTSDAVGREGYVTAYAYKNFDNITFAMLNMISSTDSYWDKIGPLEDYGDEKPQYAPTTALDSSTSSARITTEDGDFYIDPRGALRLPTDAIFSVHVTTWEIPSNIYDALSTNGTANPDEIAVSYVTDLTQNDATHYFDGKIKVMLNIPEVVKGYFSSYQLVSVDENGNSEFVEYTREGDYIYFETASLDDYALIGVDYHADGDAIPMDGFYGAGDEQVSPETGDTQTILYIILAAVSLLGIVLLNVRRKSSAR